MRRVLRVDPALDRVAGEANVFLTKRDGLACGDPDLLLHEVDAGDELGDRVLDLDPGVHLEEVVIPVGVEQAFDRPGRPVAGGPSRRDGDRSDSLAQRVVDGRRRRLLDELLMAALDRAVALAEVDDVAVSVCQHLNLDMAGVRDVLLDVDGRVREVRLALAARGLQGPLGLVR